MHQTTATILVLCAGGYLVLGVVFALPFILRGVARIDPSARGSGWGFRLAILPASIALWPLLVGRWWRRTGPPEERNAHRQAARPKAQEDAR